MKLRPLWFLLVSAVLFMTACTGVPAGPSEPVQVTSEDWQIWAAANAPETPVITLGVELPLTQSVNYFGLEALSTNGARWEVYVDGQLVAAPMGGHIAETLTLADGLHQIRLVSIAETVPSDSRYMEYGPAVSTAEFSHQVQVDTVAPGFVELHTVPSDDGKTVFVRGYLQDEISGPFKVSVDGFVETVTVQENGFFEVVLPIQNVGTYTTLSVRGYDKLNNVALANVTVVFPPNRWERISPTGELLTVDSTPGFDPFSVDVVGIPKVLTGYGEDYWVQYVNHQKVRGPINEPAGWGTIRMVLWVILGALVLGFLGFIAWQNLKPAMAMSKALNTSLAVRQDLAAANLLKSPEDVRNGIIVAALQSFLETRPTAQKTFMAFLAQWGFAEKLSAAMGQRREISENLRQRNEKRS